MNNLETSLIKEIKSTMEKEPPSGTLENISEIDVSTVSSNIPGEAKEVKEVKEVRYLNQILNDMREEHKKFGALLKKIEEEHKAIKIRMDAVDEQIKAIIYNINVINDKITKPLVEKDKLDVEIYPSRRWMFIKDKTVIDKIPDLKKYLSLYKDIGYLTTSLDNEPEIMKMLGEKYVVNKQYYQL